MSVLRLPGPHGTAVGPQRPATCCQQLSERGRGKGAENALKSIARLCGRNEGNSSPLTALFVIPLALLPNEPPASGQTLLVHQGNPVPHCRRLPHGAEQLLQGCTKSRAPAPALREKPRVGAAARAAPAGRAAASRAAGPNRAPRVTLGTSPRAASAPPKAGCFTLRSTLARASAMGKEPFLAD